MDVTTCPYWVPSKTGLGDVEEWTKHRKDSSDNTRIEANEMIKNNLDDGTRPLRMAFRRRKEFYYEFKRIASGKTDNDKETIYFQKLLDDTIYSLVAVVFGTYILDYIAWKVAKNHPLRVEATNSACRELFSASSTFDCSIESIPIAKAAGSRVFLK